MTLRVKKSISKRKGFQRGSSVASSTDSIKLSTALPWVSPQGQTGFVTEISRSQLLLSLYESSGIPDTKLEIQ